ncbi:hypothetical protein [Streptomyces sp. NRRL S-31]|nr:hypothetical protein [Streptomyces sp. NRRL S-31]
MLEARQTSWTAILDAVRLESGADPAAATDQLRDMVRPAGTGQGKAGG